MSQARTHRIVVFARLVAGTLVGLVAITFVAESIEFLIVRVLSGKSFDYLSTHQDEYFEIRNQSGILITKLLYNSVAAIIGGYLMAWIARAHARIGLAILIGIQVIALVWGGFFSELSETGPLWMWLALIVLTPAGIYVGCRIRNGDRQT